MVRTPACHAGGREFDPRRSRHYIKEPVSQEAGSFYLAKQRKYSYHLSMHYYTYILQSERTNKYYIGSTENIEERIKRHNEGRSKYTKSGIPWKLVYYEEFSDRSSAIKREKYIKNRKSKIFIAELVRTSR